MPVAVNLSARQFRQSKQAVRDFSTPRRCVSNQRAQVRHPTDPKSGRAGQRFAAQLSVARQHLGSNAWCSASVPPRNSHGTTVSASPANDPCSVDARMVASWASCPSHDRNATSISSLWVRATGTVLCVRVPGDEGNMRGRVVACSIVGLASSRSVVNNSLKDTTPSPDNEPNPQTCRMEKTSAAVCIASSQKLCARRPPLMIALAPTRPALRPIPRVARAMAAVPFRAQHAEQRQHAFDYIRHLQATTMRASKPMQPAGDRRHHTIRRGTTHIGGPSSTT